MPVSLILTTFNWPEALDLVLQSVAKQKLRPAQVIVTDDGSTVSTRSVIERYTQKLPIELVWQPDSGFRAARARNLAILRAEHDYIIFIDGDCLLPPDFIQSHLKLSSRGKIVAGSRALISKQQTARLMEPRKRKSIEHLFSGQKFSNLPLGALRDSRPHSWQTVRSCNFGVHKADIIKVKGFDEEYTGWGREDSDFIVRLIQAGVTVRSGRFAACVAHLYHRERSRDQLSSNDARFERTLLGTEAHSALRSTVGEP